MATIMIVGANQGIGYYFVEQLLKNGNQVAVLDIKIENVLSLQKAYSGKLLCIVADAKNELEIQKGVQQVVDEFKTIDVAVHNACLCTFRKEEDTEINIYRKVMEVNYFGAVHLVKAVLPYMRRQKQGRVIFTSSGVGVTGFNAISPYASSKGAIESLAKCLNIENEEYHISFHIFHPPLTKTNSASGLPIPEEFMADPEKVGYGLANNMLSKRFVICHNLSQKIQMIGCYLFPIQMGKLLSKMTSKSEHSKTK